MQRSAYFLAVWLVLALEVKEGWLLRAETELFWWLCRATTSGGHTTTDSVISGGVLHRRLIPNIPRIACRQNRNSILFLSAVQYCNCKDYAQVGDGFYGCLLLSVIVSTTHMLVEEFQYLLLCDLTCPAVRIVIEAMSSPR
jgi:hypothetical protein